MMMMMLKIFLLVAKLVLFEIRGEEFSGEYCDTEVFKAECQGQDEVILMTSARYGRMKVGRCVEYHLGYIDCYSDVTAMMDRRCSGKKSCHVRVPDAEFESTGPCLKELKTYLEANYRCIKVLTPHLESSCSSVVPINVTSSSGFISMTTPSSGSAPTTDACSWLIGGRSGQVVNLTLYDFNHNPQPQETPYRDQSRSASPCRQIGWLNDLTPTMMKRQVGEPQDVGVINPVDIPICAGGKRVTHIYTSRSHSVRLWLNINPLSSGENYLLEYSVSGCADPSNLPQKSWWKMREDGTMVVGCHGYDEGRVRNNNDVIMRSPTNHHQAESKHSRWTLKCSGGIWTGYLGNCSDSRTDAGRLNSSEDVVISYGLAIAIGAVIGVLIATGIVLVVGLVREKRDSGHHNPTGQRSHELHETVTPGNPYPLKIDDTCHQFDNSTSLNYERHPLDVLPNSSKLERNFNGREPQSRYSNRGGALLCPHHRLHPINTIDDTPPNLMEGGKGYYTSSRTRQAEPWAEEELADKKLPGPIFTVVEGKQQHDCTC